MRKVGIFGGSFSPPHIGHTRAAIEFYDALELDELLIIPAAKPPHKVLDHAVSDEDRLRMLELALTNSVGSRNIVISSLELERSGVSYTADTLAALDSDDVQLYFLCGTDMFVTLDKWRRADEIFRRAVMVLARREDDLTAEIAEKIREYEQQYAARIVTLPLPALEISSSEIRAALANGVVQVTGLEPSVEGYIRANGLYDVPLDLAPLREQVRTRMSAYRFEHTLCVEEECVKLAEIFALSEREARQLRIAAILHDVAKEVKSPRHHADEGAIVAARDFAHWVTGEICEMIALHSTRSISTTLLQSLLQLADAIGSDRTHKINIATREQFWHAVQQGEMNQEKLNKLLIENKRKWKNE